MNHQIDSKPTGTSQSSTTDSITADKFPCQWTSRLAKRQKPQGKGKDDLKSRSAERQAAAQEELFLGTQANPVDLMEVDAIPRQQHVTVKDYPWLKKWGVDDIPRQETPVSPFARVPTNTSSASNADPPGPTQPAPTRLLEFLQYKVPDSHVREAISMLEMPGIAVHLPDSPVACKWCRYRKLECVKAPGKELCSYCVIRCHEPTELRYSCEVVPTRLPRLEPNISSSTPVQLAPTRLLAWLDSRAQSNPRVKLAQKALRLLKFVVYQPHTAAACRYCSCKGFECVMIAGRSRCVYCSLRCNYRAKPAYPCGAIRMASPELTSETSPSAPAQLAPEAFSSPLMQQQSRHTPNLTG